MENIVFDEFFQKQREIQNHLLDFIDDSIDHHDIIKQLEKYQLHNNRYELKLILYFIINVSNNHQRLPSFFTKIETIIQFYKEDILSLFTNYDIFRIFRSNKRILLYVIQEKILIIDDYISSCLKNKIYIKKKYHQYFSPEFDLKPPETDLFYQNRMNGENDTYICNMIRDDSIIDFITYVNKTNISLLTRIQFSPFETNALLLKKEPELIEYSAFYGSIQIFCYLIQNKVQLTENIWEYAIHGRNAEIIHMIEENQIEPTKKCIKNSIRCHHHEITEYFLNNYPNKFGEHDFSSGIKYYNFQYFPTTLNSGELFYYLCKYDYYLIVENILNIEKMIIDINYTKRPEVKDYKNFCFSYTINLSTLNATARKGNIDILSLLLRQKELIISNYCFYKCKEIVKISLPQGLTSIGIGAFYKCYLIEEIKIPSSVTSINACAFCKCSSIKQIEIPSSVKEIQSEAFLGCSSLEQINLPPSLETIGYSLFKMCTSLKCITIPSTLTCIKIASFKGCSSLTQVIIPSSVTSIEEAAFYACSSLIEIKIPSSIKSIGFKAFKKCEKLEKVVFEDNSSLTFLGEYAFNFCSSLTEITIPSSVTSINRGCFAKCESLTQIPIPHSVKCIKEFAFNGCSSLTKINLSESLRIIKECAFKNCTSLKEILIPSSVKSIYQNAFLGCKSLMQAAILPSNASFLQYIFPSHTSVLRQTKIRHFGIGLDVYSIS